MLNSTFSFIEYFFISYGSLAVFIGAILEQTIIPVPASASVMTSSGCNLKGVNLNPSSLKILFFNIVLPATFGKTIGSAFFYYMAQVQGINFMGPISKYLGFKVEKVRELENKFKESRFDKLFIFLIRCLPIPSIVVNVFCGLIKYNFRNYVILTFLGAMVQIFMWATLGWSLVKIFTNINLYFSISYLMIPALIIPLAIYFIRKRKSVGLISS